MEAAGDKNNFSGIIIIKGSKNGVLKKSSKPRKLKIEESTGTRLSPNSITGNAKTKNTTRKRIIILNHQPHFFLFKRRVPEKRKINPVINDIENIRNNPNAMYAAAPVPFIARNK